MFSNQLKSAILQAAIQGKLTDQLPSDGHANDLIKEIEREKSQLVKQGKIKASKIVDPINEDEIQFEIPKNWSWFKLANLVVLSDGRKTTNKRLAILDAKYLRGKKSPEKIDEGELVYKNEAIILVDGENSGEVFNLNEDGYLGSTFKKLEFYSLKTKDFLLMFLRLNQKLLRDNKKGSAIPHLNKKIFYNLLVPIPPLYEQQRIVSKIELLLTKIEELENNETKLNELVTKFPDQLKSAILQAAIQGKLTDQLPSDGHANDLIKEIEREKSQLVKQGKIKASKIVDPINEDEIQFEIPKNWIGVKLEMIATIYNGNSINSTEKTLKYQNSIGRPYIATKDVNFDHTINYKNGISIPLNSNFKVAECNSILLCIEGGSAGRKIAILEKDVCFGNKLVTIKSKTQNILNEYLFYYFQSNDFLTKFQNSMKGIIGGVSINKLKKLEILLPPFNEQQRIVSKIKEFLLKVESFM